MNQITSYLREHQNVMERVINDAVIVATVERVAALATERLKAGNKLMFAGNGGSAADAQHLAAEFVSRFLYDRPGLAALALTTDTSALTAISNDYGYEQLFQRQLQALGRPGDILFAISTSGRSPSVTAGLRQARAMQITTVGLTGATGGDMPELCDHVICIPSSTTAHIQEVHITLGHIICGLVEAACHPRS